MALSLTLSNFCTPRSSECKLCSRSSKLLKKLNNTTRLCLQHLIVTTADGHDKLTYSVAISRSFLFVKTKLVGPATRLAINNYY